jgi:anaerobic C4-dicarboxylate transporter
MNGKFKLNYKHYTGLFKSHHTFVDALRRAFRGLLIHLTENLEWQEKVREEIYYLEDKEMKTREEITSRNAKCLRLFILGCRNVTKYDSSTATARFLPGQILSPVENGRYL